MGNVSSEISNRVSSMSIEDLKKTYVQDIDLLSFTEELFDPVLLQNNASFDIYKMPGKSIIKSPSELLEQEVSYSFSFSQTKQKTLINSLISQISSSVPTSPLYEVFQRRLSSLCGMYESVLRQDKLRDKLLQEVQIRSTVTSDLPVSAQLGLSFGISTLLLMLKRTIKSDPDMFSELISETSLVLSQFQPMSCVVNDPMIEKALDKASGFFEATLRGEIRGISNENQLASISPLLGIALITGNVTSALSIILKFLSTNQEKGFTSIMNNIMPLVKALNRLAMLKDINYSWESGEEIVFNEEKLSASGPQSKNMFAYTEAFTKGVRFYDIVIEKFAGTTQVGICDGENIENKVVWNSDGTFLNLGQTSSIGSYALNDRIGVCVDYKSNSFSLYKNKTRVAGPLTFGFPSAKVFCFIGKDTCFKLVTPDLPTGVTGEINIYEETGPIHALFTSLQQTITENLDSSRISPQLMGAFLLACIEKNNEKHRKILEKQGKSAPIKQKELLSIDVREQCIQYLHQIIKNASMNKLSPELTQIVLKSALNLIRSHLMVYRNYPQIQISRDLKMSLYETLQQIYAGKFAFEQRKEAGETISEFFEIFFTNSEDQMNFLTNLLENYDKSLKNSGEERNIILHMIANVSKPLSLFDSFYVESNTELIEKYMDILLEISYKVSVKSLNEEIDTKPIFNLLMSSIKCLLSQFAKSQFNSKYLSVVLLTSKKLLAHSISLIPSLKSLKKDLANKVKNTFLHIIPTTFFTILVLCRLDIAFITEILEPALEVLKSLQEIKSPAPEIAECKMMSSQVYESEHPYPNSSDTTYNVKVPYASRYLLTFDSACITEANCDYLKLYSDETKSNLLFTWSGTGFPTTEIEVKSPSLCFEFHSDGSVNNWGFKININAEIRSKTFKSFWPSDLTTTLTMFIANSCKKLITFEFEPTSDPAEILPIINSPICKFGIKDKVLSLFSVPATLPEKLIFLSSKQENSEQELKGLSKKLMHKVEKKDDLVSYSLAFGKWPKRYSEIEIVEELIRGSDNVISYWRDLKQASGIKGPASNIGGSELNQAERALFGVYISLFDITDTVQNIVNNTVQVGGSVRYIVKQVCNVRVWAQKRKQEMIDAGKVLGYAEIGKDIVDKCALILNSEFRKGLLEAGVQLKLSELTELIRSSNTLHSATASQKWKTVKGAMATIQKLGNLLSIAKPKPPKNDVVEISKIWNLLLPIFDSKLSVEEMLTLVDKRRIRGLSRALGYKFFHVLASNVINAELLEVFIQCVTSENGKADISKGLEATDPVLTNCVQSAFYAVYKIIIHKLSDFNPENLLDLYFLMNLIESINYPVIESDLHYFLDLNLSGLIQKLLEWSKGNFSNLKVSKIWSTQNCITSLKLSTENKPESISIPNSENLFLQANKGENALPIVEMKWSAVLLPDYEDAVGPITISEEVKYIIIKRASPKPKEKYLAGLNASLESEYRDYSYFLTVEDPEEKIKITQLKQKISEISFALIKLLMTSLTLEPLQEAITNELFKELHEVKASFSLSLDETVTANTWLGKINSPTLLQRNPMDIFLKKLYKEADPNLSVRKIIETHVKIVDFGLKGVLKPEDEAVLPEKAKKLIKKYQDFRNSKGEIDFFRYLSNLYEKRLELDEASAVFIEKNRIFQGLASDFYEASAKTSLLNVSGIIMSAISQSSSQDFTNFITIFVESEVAGITSQGEFPPEFKNSEGNYDFYLAINKIQSDPEKFASYYPDVQQLVQEFGVFPSSCLDLNKEQSLFEDYQGTVLWLLFSQCSHSGMKRALSRKERISALLLKTFSSSQELSALASLILAHILPTQHSFESLSLVWKDLINFTNVSKEFSSDYIRFCFYQIGVSAGFYLQNSNWNLVKRNLTDSLEVLKKLVGIDRWKEKIVEIIKEIVAACNKKIEEGHMITEVEAGVITFLAVNGPSYSGVDLVVQPLSKVKLELASVSEGLVWTVSDDSCKIFSLESEAFHSETTSKVTQVILNSDFYRENIDSSIFEMLLKTWSLIQNFKPVSVKSSARNFLSNKVIIKRIESLVLETLITLSDKKQGIVKSPQDHSVTWKTLLAIKENISKKLENKAKVEITKQLSPEEIQTRIAGLDEKNQILVSEVASLGYPNNLILAALDAGLTTLEDITDHILGNTVPKPIFALSKWIDEDLEVIDLSETGNFYQSRKGHMIISTSVSSQDKKVYNKSIEESVFHGSKWFVEDLTFFVAISGVTSQHKCEFGMKIGEFDLKFESVVENTQIDVSGKALLQIVTQPTYVFRINASASGELELNGENFNAKVSVLENSVFSGTRIGNFSIYLKEGNKVELKGLTIYEGKIERSVKFFEEDLESRESGSTFIKASVIESGLTKNRLGLLGAPVALAKSLSSQYYDLEKCVTEIVKQDSNTWPNPLGDVQSLSISSVKMFNSASEIETGYEEVLILENGEISKIKLTNHKIIAVKKIPDSNAKTLSSLFVEETAGSELIGDIAVDPSQNSQKIYGLYSDKTPNIKNIALILSKQVQRVSLPFGYSLLCNKEGLALNLAKRSDNFALFLAYTVSDYMLGYPIRLLSAIKQPIPTYGLENSSESKSQNLDLAMFQNLSIVELFAAIIEKEEHRIQHNGKDFMMSISAHKPEALVTSVENKGVAYLVNMFQNDFSSLEPFLQATLATNNKSVIEKILAECIFQLISAVFSSDGNNKEKVFETAHSYGNNMDVDDEIYFPGATKLIIEFDPQCCTEANADYLVFYKKKNHEEEVKKLTGMDKSCWQNFEYVGDRLYTYFHTDSSVVYWGYKFTVKPVVKKKNSSRKFNMPAILHIIDYFSKIGYSFLTSKFFQKEIILPLLMYIHINEDMSVIEKCIGILSRLIVTTVEPYHVSILNLLVTQASIMQKGLSQGPNSVLISILSLLSKFHKARTYIVKERWFIDFFNCYYDMKDLTEVGNNLDSFLFETFKEKILNSVEKSYESTHNYKRDPRSEQITIPGASSLEVIFDPNSGFDDGDEIFFSFDAEGQVPITSYSPATKALTWSNTLKGPDISITNDTVVTRTNSSGWGIAVTNEVISGICLTITINIDNCDDSAYWYIGLIDPTDTINYSTNMANDSGFRLWSWKKTGDFMKKGESTGKGTSFGFNKGDVVKLIVNCPETTVTFVRNGEVMHSFNDISEKTVLAMSFGGSNQIGSIVSATEEGKFLAPLKKRKLKVNGDSCFFHFPINAGIYDTFVWENNNEPTVTVTPNNLVRTGGEGPSIHFTANAFVTGRHYCEFEFSSISEKSLVAVLVSKESINRNQSALGLCAAYKNLGGIMIGSNNTSCKGFKSGELIGAYIDFTKPEIRFYKNRLLVAACKIEIVNEPYRIGVMFNCPNQEVKINSETKFPDDVDMLGIRQQLRYGSSASWGYKFKVVPHFSERSSETLEQILKFAPDEDKKNWKEYLEKFSAYIRSGAAEELVQYLDETSVATGKNSIDLQNADISPQPAALIYYKNLEKLNVKDIQELSRVFQSFNSRVKVNLPMFNLKIVENPSDFQRAFLGSRKFIFFDLKKALFNSQLEKTKSDLRVDIVIDRTKAMRYQSQGKIDMQGQFSIFGQVLRCMNQKNNSEFRNAERIFKVSYRGEGAIDAGGPYNEVMSNICDELQSNFLPLLVPTQNHTGNIGENRDAWVINSKKLQFGEEMFAFLGKLIGVAIRTQNNLNLSLAPLTWKKIVLEEIDLHDLKSIDEICFQLIEIMKNLESKGINRDNFNATFSDEFFTTRLTNGEVVDLVPNGKELAVHFENALEYSRLIQSARLAEADYWYRCIRKGMSAVIPIDLLNLFSWKQVESLVCGAGDIKVDILRANTEYTNGTNESDPHVSFFWEVLNEMNSKEKQLFLRFVWGRSRLPASKTFTHMKISKLVPKGPVDNYLPVTHTCFFTIDLPPYNSKEVMKEKILYAITHCTAIDLDTAPTSGGWEED